MVDSGSVFFLDVGVQLSIFLYEYVHPCSPCYGYLNIIILIGY